MVNQVQFKCEIEFKCVVVLAVGHKRIRRDLTMISRIGQMIVNSNKFLINS